jgi:hypothetical protein
MLTTVTDIIQPTTIFSGKKLVASAGTDEVLAASQVLRSGVTVKALAGNSGIVYIGPEGVSSSTGLELSAKESAFIECSNLSAIWIDAASSSDGVTYIAS